MKSKLAFTLFFSIFICMIAFIGLANHDSAVASQASSDKIEAQLADQIAANGSADFIVRFSEQADLSPAYSMDWAARGEFVYNTLRETAARSQVNAKTILDAQGLASQTFIAGNDLYVYGKSQPSTNGIAVVEALAALPEVSFIRAARTYYIDPIAITKPLENIHWAGDLLANHDLTMVGSSTQATTDWGITDTKANQAWYLGARGSGIKVASIDTGVQWDHPALINQFACPGNPSDPKCWKDPSNICGGTACDNNGHGTHTMGTMIAKDNPALPYIAGMAPDASWIACKGCENDSCTDLALNACADWILAPNNDSNNRPNVVNNSWGGGGGNTWFQAKVQAWVAAGIFPAFSAGNSGQKGCSTLGSPGDYQESFASAAHDVNRNIAYFSSRGPSAFGYTPYTKPNISAPGVSICSTVPGYSWSCDYSGTSMASPHTAGAVAQLWSCAPSLVGKVDATFQALQNSADTPPAGTCGAPPDGQGNYTYGYGYLDVLNLVNLYCSPNLGKFHGHVYDQYSNPVVGASITVNPAITGNFIDTFTNSSGYYTMTLAAGTYNVTASKNNYASQTVNGVTISTNQVTTRDFIINNLKSWTLIPLPEGCPDWNRFDGEYFPVTGKVYFLGGRSGTNFLGTIYSFDPNTKICTNTGASMPVPVANYTIVPVNNGTNQLLCTFGGNTATTSPTTAVQCYNPLGNTVSVVSNLPGQLGAYIPGGAAVVGNTVYVFGGYRSSPSPYQIAETWAWNPVTNTWSQKAYLSMARGYIEVAVADGKIYAFGGDVYDGTNLTAQTITEVYNPSMNTWNNAAVTDLPAASGEGRAFGFDINSVYTLAGKIILAGGGQWPYDTNTVIAYNINTNTYDDTFPDLNISRRDQAGFFIPGDPGAMWVFGGHSSSDNPPYAPPEYYRVFITKYNYLPLINR